MKQILYLDEEWRDLKYKDIKQMYEISNVGRIRNKKTGKILKLFISVPGTNLGYIERFRYSDEFTKDLHLSVSLRLKDKTKKSNGKKSFSVHRLVASTFIPNPNNKPQVHHINGFAWDNRISNLMWVTSSEHMKLSYELGQRDIKFGVMSPNSKFTEDQYVLLVKLLKTNSYNIKELSEITDISVAAIRTFINNDNIWSSVRGDFHASEYTQKQSISEKDMRKVFELASENKYSIIEISRKTGVKPSTISNVVNHSISNKWKYLYDQYNIPDCGRSKDIIVKDKKTTNDIITLIKNGKSSIDIIKELKLDMNKSTYGKVYRLSMKYK